MLSEWDVDGACTRRDRTDVRPGMIVAGMAWLSVANTLAVGAQTALPDWVRARGMAVQQMAGAAQELSNLSLELQSVVSRFRLGEAA